jgi:hypothetical protein
MVTALSAVNAALLLSYDSHSFRGLKEAAQCCFNNPYSKKEASLRARFHPEA